MARGVPSFNAQAYGYQHAPMLPGLISQSIPSGHAEQVRLTQGHPCTPLGVTSEYRDPPVTRASVIPCFAQTQHPSGHLPESGAPNFCTIGPCRAEDG
jgi:hypothetical protein